MTTEEKKKKKNEEFLIYWETKRENKIKYTLITSATFSIIVSIIYCLIKHGFSTDFFNTFPYFFLIASMVYAVYVYFVEYNLHEKRYQKLKKKK